MKKGKRKKERKKERKKDRKEEESRQRGGKIDIRTKKGEFIDKECMKSGNAYERFMERSRSGARRKIAKRSQNSFRSCHNLLPSPSNGTKNIITALR